MMTFPPLSSVNVILPSLPVDSTNIAGRRIFGGGDIVWESRQNGVFLPLAR